MYISIRRLAMSLCFAAVSLSANAEISLDKLTMPEGFKIEVFADKVTNARQMALGATGVVYVGSRSAGEVNAVVDTNGDGKADSTFLVAKDLYMPSGLAYRDGKLYVAAVDKVYEFDNIDTTYMNSPTPKVVYDKLPSDRHHGWKYVDFGPDGWLYIPVGTPCNVCITKGGEKLDNELYDSIVKLNVETGELKYVARGVRNSVGFDWNPATNTFFFTDNGRDWLGDELPPCEVNKVTKEGEHFGYPYFHGGVVADPEFGMNRKASEFTAPELQLNAHVAPLGMHFAQSTMFPKEYLSRVFVAEHGSWNRSNKVGYRIMMATVENDSLKDYVPFMTGFLHEDKVWGRPVAFLAMPDGSLLVSDDFANAIYRITYQS